MKPHLIFALFVAILVIPARAQFQPRPPQRCFSGVVTFRDGRTKQCLVYPPTIYSQKEIVIREKEKSEKIDIPSDSLTRIIIEPSGGNFIEFDRFPTAYGENKKPSKPSWLLALVKGYATLYMKSEYHIEAEDVSTITSYTAGRSLPSFTYYLRKKDKEAACYFAETSDAVGMLGLHATLKKGAHAYLSEDPELVRQIDDRKYTHHDVPEIIRIYNAFMDGKK